MKIQKAIEWIQQELVALESPRLEAEWMLESLTQKTRTDWILRPELQLEPVQIAQLKKWIQRRKTGEPLAYILGHWGFYGREFKVGPGVLIPRPETEFVVEEALRKFPHEKAVRVADFGAGSGCIGLTLACERSGWIVDLVENSVAALGYIEENRVNLNKQSQTHVLALRVEDLPELPQYGLIVANPPYIADCDPDVQPTVRAFEPHSALFSPDNGMSALKAWSVKATKLLCNKGAFVTEIGYQQSATMIEFLKSLPDVQNIRVIRDFADHERVISWEVNRGQDVGEGRTAP